MSRLRKALPGGGELLVTRERGYQLQVDPERVDATRFERLLGEARAEHAAGRPEGAAARLEEGLALWRGEPLADLAYEPFAQAEAARLADLRAAAQELQIDAKLALGGHAEVIAPLEALIEEHPFREHLRAQLMLALYRSDRQAEALQAYQDARRRLVEELGIEPGERLRELERAVLAQDPSLALPVAEPSPDLPPPAAPAPDSRRARRRAAASSASCSPTSSARPASASGSTRSRCTPCSIATPRSAARSSSATAARSRASSATRWSASSACPSCTRTTPCARSAPRSRCARRAPS